MLVTLSALVVALSPALVQGAAGSQAAAAMPPIARSLTSKDSSRVLRLARNAQGDFEILRRRLLPLETLGGGAGCEAIVGRYCYRQQFTVAPPEAPEIIAARTRLLEILDSASAMIPGDRWLLGQRVRYLLEAGRANAADSVAITCAARGEVAATTSWCLALIGYTAQQFGYFNRADAAYTLALAEMPASERCKWQDLGLLLGRSAGPYRRGDCQTRDSVVAGFWRLVQPLYLNEVNDLRTEFLARITRLYIVQGTRTPVNDWWGSDDRETVLRYGAPLWYTRGEMLRGDLRPPIAGFRREPSFNFFPDAHVFASPDQLAVEDWEFWNVLDRPTYAPTWADSFLPLTDHQVALFRRGDSAFIVAAFDANDGAPARITRRVGTFVALIDRGGVLTPFGKQAEQTGVGVVTTLLAPWRPLVVSLEGLNSSSRTAVRARFAPKLPPATGRLGLSDLLFYTPRDSAPASLAEAMPRVLHAERAPSDRQIGVFWETYGVRPQGESFAYTLVVVPSDEGLFHRALVKLRLAEPERSVSLQWRETIAAVDGIASRGVTVDLSRLRPGRYSVRLMLTSGTDLPIVTERAIEIL